MSNATNTPRRDGDAWVFPGGRRIPIIAGADPVADPLAATSARVERAREAHRDAVVALRDAAAAIENADADADVEALEQAFTEAEGTLEHARSEMDLAERVHRARTAQVPDNGPGIDARVNAEPLTYRRDKPEMSYLMDLARMKYRHDDVAKARVERHGREMKDEYQRRQEIAERVQDQALERMLDESFLPPELREQLRASGLLVQKRAVQRIEGLGGEFMPPVWLLDEYADRARAGRPFANWLRRLPLPDNTDEINIPRIVASGTTGMHGDNQSVTETDWTTAMVRVPRRTIAGQITMPIAALDSTPMAFDELIFGDLLADKANRVESQCFDGTGAGDDVLGILNTAGINTVSYTDATPTFPELWPKIWGAVDAIEQNRKRTPDGIWFASRRYNWIAAQLDAQNRPFVLPVAQGPMNALGISASTPEFEGPIVNIGGYTGYKDNTVPTNKGAGTNEDRIVVTRSQDHVLMESDDRIRVLEETKGDKLQVIFQAWAYVAVTFARYPAATTVISGTGLVTPTF
jgi:HK97 family phage major capsid protein